MGNKNSGARRRSFIGKKFGRVTIIGDAPDKKIGEFTSRYVYGRCECGNERVFPLYTLTRGSAKSCGCIAREVASNGMKARRASGETDATKHGHARKTGNSKTYTSWLCMKNRCKNKDWHGYKHYGGRGITLCDRWELFINFLSDMGERPDGHTLDRVDVDGNYCPENCRWVPASIQRANRRDSKT